MARAVYKCSLPNPEAAYGYVALGPMAAYSWRSIISHIGWI
jgi:hypothetical protein